MSAIKIRAEGEADTGQKRLYVENAFVVDRLFPDTIRVKADKNGGSWSVGGVDFFLSFNRLENSIDTINLERSDEVSLPIAEEDKIALHRSGHILTSVGGSILDGILPDSISKLDNGDKEIVIGEQKLVFSARKTIAEDNSIHDVNLSVDGYSSDFDDAAVRLVPFGNLLICDNGDLVDGRLPDKIERISATERYFYYGEEVFSLSWVKTDRGITNIKFEKKQVT